MPFLIKKFAKIPCYRVLITIYFLEHDKKESQLVRTHHCSVFSNKLAGTTIQHSSSKPSDLKKN